MSDPTTPVMPVDADPDTVTHTRPNGTIATYVPERALIETQAALAAATEEQSRAWALLTGERWTQTRTEGSLVEAAERVVAALAAAEEGRLAALDIAKGAYEARDEARAALAAATAFSDAQVKRLQERGTDLAVAISERDALRDDLARVTAERDDARATIAEWQMAGLRGTVEGLRETVRELGDGLRFAKDHLVDTHDCDETTTIDALLAKHAAPEPTLADAKENT